MSFFEGLAISNLERANKAEERVEALEKQLVGVRSAISCLVVALSSFIGTDTMKTIIAAAHEGAE